MASLQDGGNLDKIQNQGIKDKIKDKSWQMQWSAMIPSLIESKNDAVTENYDPLRN